MTSNHPAQDSSPRAQLRRRAALHVMLAVLVPLGLLTVLGLVALWPHHTDEHVLRDQLNITQAGGSYPHGQVTKVREVSCEDDTQPPPGGLAPVCATLRVRVTSGPQNGQQVTVSLPSQVYAVGVKIGQRAELLPQLADEGQAPVFAFGEFTRSTPLLVLFAVAVVAVVVVARRRGLASLVGLGFAGFILTRFMFPALLSGENPVAVSLVGSAAIMFVVLYAAHGFSVRTTTALLGTLSGLGLVTAPGQVWIVWALPARTTWLCRLRRRT